MPENTHRDRGHDDESFLPQGIDPSRRGHGTDALQAVRVSDVDGRCKLETESEEIRVNAGLSEVLTVEHVDGGEASVQCPVENNVYLGFVISCFIRGIVLYITGS